MSKHLFFRFTLPVAIGLLLPDSGSSADWPHWRGPLRNGISADAGMVENDKWNKAPIHKWPLAGRLKAVL